MPSVIDICNDALSHTGTDIFIASLEEKSKEAKLCARWYPRTRDELLRTFKWNFAQRRTILADMGDPPTGWLYRYRYPIDCLFLGKVYPIGEYTPGVQQDELIQRTRTFEVASDDDGGRIILTNVAEAEALYTARIENPGVFDELFTMSLTFKLAANISMPLVSDPKVTEYLRQKTRESLSEAFQVSLSEAQEPPEMEARTIRARFSAFVSDEERNY